MVLDAKHEFDKYRENYSSEINGSLALAGQGHQFYLEIKANHLIDLLQSKFGHKQPVKVLDVGCGHGYMHHFFDIPNIELSGCDPAATVINEAKELNSQVLYTANNGEALPYADNTFDVAFTVCVMHHVPPEMWVGFLREMKRVVKSGGIIAIYEHNPYNPLTRRVVDNCPVDANAVLLNSGELTKLMLEAEIVKPKTEYLIFFPFDNRIFRLIEKGLSLLPLGAQYTTYAMVEK